MAQPRTPRAVFHDLINSVAEGRWEDAIALYAEQTNVEHPFDPLAAPPLRTREELRQHFRPGDLQVPRLRRRPANISIHETADPEVVIGEFAYQGTVVDTGATFSVPCIFVLRVRNGQIVESRDYIDHFRSARVWGVLDDFIEAIRTG